MSDYPGQEVEDSGRGEIVSNGSGVQLDESIRRYRYRGSYELRDLEAAIRDAYASKVLQSQIAERRANLMAEKVREKHAADLIRDQEIDTLAVERRRLIEESKRRDEYREELKEQIEARLRETLVREEADRLERQLLIEVDRLRDELEERRKMEAKMALAVKLRAERRVFAEIREIHEDKEREKLANEMERQRKYLDEVERRTRELGALRRERVERRNYVIEAMARNMVDFESEKREREDVISELVAEEMRCEALIEERDRELRERMMKDDLAECLKNQIEQTEENRRRVQDEDDLFAEAVMLRVMQDERVERMTAEARKRACFRYRQELECLMEERRMRRREELDRIREYRKMERDCEIKRRDLVRTERERLLMEHAENIAGFLNKDLLTMEERQRIEKLLKN
ncbi:meiosis-specific nuclear structural protein 1 [Cephus cinctus]|uniref:Meiosis-specific nuclear structural protein 1 n=1 Tax=Cephus cinctus TaxID=211228 RepID=A0AAJ7FIS5_CEPCN|nr:meiosis-specific nuclear structural protein 1 [Cephus cinctus]